MRRLMSEKKGGVRHFMKCEMVAFHRPNSDQLFAFLRASPLPVWLSFASAHTYTLSVWRILAHTKNELARSTLVCSAIVVQKSKDIYYFIQPPYFWTIASLCRVTVAQIARTS